MGCWHLQEEEDYPVELIQLNHCTDPLQVSVQEKVLKEKDKSES